MWQDCKKCFVAVMLVGALLLLLVVGQLAQTSSLPAYSDLRLFHPEEVSNHPHVWTPYI